MQNIEELAGMEAATQRSAGAGLRSDGDPAPKKRTVKIRSPIIARPAPVLHQAPPRTLNWAPIITGVGLSYILAIGAIDLLTPHGMRFEFFYLLGCALVGWAVGLRFGLLLTIFSALFMVSEDLHGTLTGGLGWTVWWNSVARLAGFAATVWLADKAGRLTRALEGTVRERTASLQMEVEEHRSTLAQLRETLQIFRQMTENITEVFWVTNPAKSRVNFVSIEFERIWGQPRQTVYNSHNTWLEAIHPEDRERIKEATYTKQITGEYDEQYRVVRPDGSMRWVHDRAFPVRDENGEVYRIAGITEDITERKRNEEALRRNEERMRATIIETSDREQARIGQDIHDGLCQQLVGAAFDAKTLVRALGSQMRPETKTAERIYKVLDEAISESRRVSQGLYPVRLKIEGLVPALEELAGRMSERFGVQCVCEASGAVECAETTATHLYRIAQEAVNNAIKHSGANSICIRLVASAEKIELEVKDNGMGIEHSNSGRSGMGMHIMNYRAGSVGGTVGVNGSAGGTVVRCVVPGRGK